MTLVNNNTGAAPQYPTSAVLPWSLPQTQQDWQTFLLQMQAKFPQLDQSQIPYLITPAEMAAGITPTNYWYPPGQLPRYGGDPTGGNVAATTTALQAAVSLSAQTNGGVAVYIPSGSYFQITPATVVVTGTITVRGEGKNSKFKCDGIVLTNHAGSYSVFENFWMENITAPWIVTRNPANWAATIPYTSLVQSNTQLGYQPTVNDPEYSTWVANIPAVGTQNIGPVIYCDQAATDIVARNIYGRFFRVEIMDAVSSTIQGCEGRGGKGVWGALEFDNWTNGVQRGSNNRALDNRIQYASFCGVFFSANDDFVDHNNQCDYNGESGSKTLQAQGITFTASVSGATSGTLSTSIASGNYTCNFSDGETRTITVSGTTVSWTTALSSPAVPILTASVYQTTLNPQCFRGQIGPLKCSYNYYDGADCDSTFPGTNDSAITQHHIFDIYAYNNGGDGINVDGNSNDCADLHCVGNRRYGVWNEGSFSSFVGVRAIGNNTGNDGSTEDFLVGGQGNCVDGVFINFTASAGFPLYAAQVAGQVPHVIRNVTTIGGTNFYGNPGAVIPTVDGNIDATTGATCEQCFTLDIANNAGVMQHAIYSEPGGAALSNFESKINAAAASYNNTPTGTDSSTAMAFGGKIGSANAFIFWMDTALQSSVNAQILSAVAFNSTGTSLAVTAQFSSININGVTRVRLCFAFANSASGATFNLNTTNVPSSDKIRVMFRGLLA